MSPAARLDPALVQKLARGYILSQAIYVAARLRIADHLRDGPKAADALGRAVDAHGPSLRRVMRLLAAEGIFTEDEDGRFGLAEASEVLMTDAPKSARSFILGWTTLQATYHAFGELLHAVKAGETAFDRALGRSFYEALEHDHKMADDYNTAMNSTTEGFAAAVHAYDWSSFRTVVDVGGGAGGFLVTLLRKYPRLRGILFERASVIEVAARELSRTDVGDRIAMVAGDFFVEVPAGHEGYFLSTVLHVFDDDRALKILQACSRAMPPDAKLLVFDGVMPPGPASGMRPYVDMMMLVLTSGKDRTQAEFDVLFQQAGLRSTRAIPAPPSSFTLIEAVRKS